MFKVRRAWLSGNCILQHSEGDNWVDHYPTPDLETGFHIVGLEFMQDRENLIAILMGRIKLYEHRAAISRKSRLKRKAPTLVDAIPSPLKLAAERIAIERAFGIQATDGLGNRSVYTTREPQP